MFSKKTVSGISWFKQYRTKACRTCHARSKCTKSKECRLIHRSEYAEYYQRNLQNTKEKEHLYRRRQAIVEHPYGTIKRQWGFSYILTKKRMDRAAADVGFMMIAYNLRRIGNILTLKVLKEYLAVLVSLFLAIFGLIEAVLLHSGRGRSHFPGILKVSHRFRKNRVFQENCLKNRIIIAGY